MQILGSCAALCEVSHIFTAHGLNARIVAWINERWSAQGVALLGGRGKLHTSPQTAVSNMKVLVEFLSLRPIWTRRCLEIVWYVYFLATLLQLAFLISVAYPAIGKADIATYFSFALQIVHSLAILALVRIFLELALTFLIKPTVSASL